MNKLTVAVLAVMLAVLSGCATNGGGDLVGTSAFGNYDHSSPFPYTVDIIAGG